MINSGSLAMYTGSVDNVLTKGEVYRVLITRKKVDGEVWPTLYAYNPRRKIEGGYWLKMLQYASEHELEKNWKEVGDDSPRFLAGDRPVPVDGSSGNGHDIAGDSYRSDVRHLGEDEKEKIKDQVRSEIYPSTLYLSLAEECSELSQACLKQWRALTGLNPTPVNTKTGRRHVIEEYTDVILCAEMLDLEVDPDIFARKLRRWVDRIESAKRFRDISTS